MPLRSQAPEPLRTGSRRRAEEWALVLEAEGVAHAVERGEAGFGIVVAPRDRARAEEVLEAFERENAEPRAALPPEHGPTAAGFAIAVWLVAFFLVTGSRGATAWFARGGADAAAILAGETWRAVTALTLHADLAHVAGNALASCVFATLVCRRLGPGAGGWLLLLAGAAGNVANAFVRGGSHVSVGASTALFGAVGILAGLEAARRSARRPSRRRAWVPLAAGLALLAMLGTGDRADLLAHLFGLVAGGALGVAAGLFVRRPPGAVAQGALAATALAAVGACWWLALR